MEEELFLKTIKPTTNETYAILLDKVNDSFVAEVMKLMKVKVMRYLKQMLEKN